MIPSDVKAKVRHGAVNRCAHKASWGQLREKCHEIYIYI